MRVASGLFSFFLLAPFSLLAQGSLTPPGAPAATMKTLTQIEPRTPISSVPFTINASGSYYLTANLTTAVSNAIVINANSVTLDLGGFTISSTVANAANGGTAILIGSGVNDISICNGHIRGGVTNNLGVYSGPGFFNGISYSANSPQNTRISGIFVAQVLNDGIRAGDYDSGAVESCTVRTAGGYGVVASSVKGCRATECYHAISGREVSDCIGQSDEGAIAANLATSCSGQSLKGMGVSCAYMALNCYGESESDHGIVALTAQNCYGSSQKAYGVFATCSALNCVGDGDYTGVQASNAENCDGSSAHGTGINCVSVQNSHGVSYDNNSFGIHALVANNSRGYNTGSGTGLYAEQAAICCSGYSYNGTGLSARIANSCVGTSDVGTPQAVTYKYNMP